MTQVTPKATVILSSYNRPQLVRQAIRSVLDQTLSNLELIIADDGSNEDTLQAIYFECSTDERVVLQLHHVRERSGMIMRYAQRINQALNKATGETISYLPDDDLFFPERLAGLSAFLDSHPKVFTVYGRSYTRQFGSDLPHDPERARLCDLPPDREFVFNRDPPDQAYWWPGDLADWAAKDSRAVGWAPDHGQVMHRRCELRWPELPEECTSGGCPDHQFYTNLKKLGPFCGTDIWSTTKRYHGRSGMYRFDGPRE